MNCPHCAAPIGEHVTDYGDMACANCGLAGPRDVLEALAARLGPAGVLAEVGEPAKRDEPGVVELPADAFERMLAEMARHNDLAEQHVKLLERFLVSRKRRLAQAEDDARRIAGEAGPTTGRRKAKRATKE